MIILLILLINVIGFAIPFIIIFAVSSHLAKKNNIPFKIVLKFNDYVKDTIGGLTLFQFVILLIDLVIFFYVGGNGYTVIEKLTFVTCTNLMLFEPALSLTALDMAHEATNNIKKTLSSMPIKF